MEECDEFIWREEPDCKPVVKRNEKIKTLRDKLVAIKKWHDKTIQLPDLWREKAFYDDGDAYADELESDIKILTGILGDEFNE